MPSHDAVPSLMGRTGVQRKEGLHTRVIFNFHHSASADVSSEILRVSSTERHTNPQTVVLSQLCDARADLVSQDTSCVSNAARAEIYQAQDHALRLTLALNA